MKNSIRNIPVFLLFWLLCLTPLFGQTYSTGAILDPVRYEQTDAKPVLVSRSYTAIPQAVSLKQYAPFPGNQDPYSTCVGWATAFAARTISESVALNRTNQTQNSNNVFSPIFIYKGSHLRLGVNPTGHEGACVPDVLNFMMTEGAVKRQTFENTTDFLYISLPMFSNNQRYPISGYVRLFSNSHRNAPGLVSERVPPVKKSLAAGKPVVIGMNTPHSFHQRGTEIWRPYEDPYYDYGGHAMCVVGYDDNKYGGAFEIQNSWGTNWGNNGYIWITYTDFALYVFEAYEIIENLAIYKDATRYAASIEINVFNDRRGMPVTYDSQGFYKTRYSYPEGTIFQFMMTNKFPAYVYAFSADSGSSIIERVFPETGVSPVLDYTDSTIAWPGENLGMILEGSASSHYLVVLYSKQALDIGTIERRFAGERGSFPDRVARAVGSNFIPYRDVQYNSGQIEFSAVSTNPTSVFGLLLAIEH